MNRCEKCGSEKLTEVWDSVDGNGPTMVGILCVNCGETFKVRPTSFPPNIKVSQ